MKKWLTYGAAAVAVAYVVALFFFDPQESRLFPRCFFHWATGLKCSGCGAQRALHCLLHGDIMQALRYNCFLIVFMPPFVLGLYKGPFANKKWYPYIGFCVMILFTIARNLPGATF